MTAPAPSLMEQATIDRLGVFDEEILRELEEHTDKVPVCSELTCSSPATHTVTCVECRHLAGLACTPHADQLKSATGPVKHRPCGTVLPARELLRVVPL